MAKPSPGLGVDSEGHPVIDPTENVKDVLDAATKRHDDLRELERLLIDARLSHVKEIGDLRAQHQRELDDAESQRLNAIRQVDREEIIKASAATTVIAEALRNQHSASMSEVNKRLSALELQASQVAGKSAGVNWVGVFIAGAVSLIGGLLGIAGVLYAVLSN